MTARSRLKILVAPLDWGLGHTTRSIPVMEALQRQGAELILAGNPIQRSILTELFPRCRFLPLEGYNVRYSRSAGAFLSKIIQQAPRILATIRKENVWLRDLVAVENIDGVISDNRFGLHHPRVPCVFITHQLQPQTAHGKWPDNWVRGLNYRQINRFDQCWIPDIEGPDNLAGQLSHPGVMPEIPCRYIGPLSRMHKVARAAAPGPQLLVLLSGPEPQRTHLERLVLEQLSLLEGPVVIVRGLPLSPDSIKVPHAAVFNHLPKEQLTTLMQEASYILCRSGYSTVMDINAIGARAILIPTPGQTEQQYLGDYLMRQGFAVVCRQDQLHLPTLLQQASRFDYRDPIAAPLQLLDDAVGAFLATCRQPRKGIKT